MKAELRKKILQEMKAIPREQKQFIDQTLTERLLQHSFTTPLLPRSQGHRKLPLFSS